MKARQASSGDVLFLFSKTSEDSLARLLRVLRREGYAATPGDPAGAALDVQLSREPSPFYYLETAGGTAEFPEQDLLGRADSSPGPDSLLSERERETLFYISQGLPDKAVADRMGIRMRTVRFHLENARKKLKAQNRTEAVVKAGFLRPFL